MIDGVALLKRVYIPCSIRSDVLSVKVADSVEVNGLVEQLHLESVDTVIVFRTAEVFCVWCACV